MCLPTSPGVTTKEPTTAPSRSISTSHSKQLMRCEWGLIRPTPGTAARVGPTELSLLLETASRLLARARASTSTSQSSTSSTAVASAAATEDRLTELTSGSTRSRRRQAPESLTIPPTRTWHAPLSPTKASARAKIGAAHRRMLHEPAGMSTTTELHSELACSQLASSTFPPSGFCGAITSYPNATISEYGSIEGADNMAKEILARGPISCGIDAGGILKYTGGVVSTPGEGVDHVVSVVGWGTEGDKQYWMVRK